MMQVISVGPLDVVAESVDNAHREETRWGGERDYVHFVSDWARAS